MYAKSNPCLLIFVVVVALAQTAGGIEPTISAPQQGFLVLANGSVLKGVVAIEGEQYRVLLEKGTLKVRADQVDFFCQSMEEAYIRRKARRIPPNATADAHLEMARWCVQHHLFASAAIELQNAQAIDPKQPQLHAVERQITQARQLTLKRETATSTHVMDKQVHPAVAAVPDEPAAFGEIPPWARTEFIKRVQPMMVHSCATAGCHMLNSSQQMLIERSALDGVGNPDVINRNLMSVLAQVDLTEPETSRLLAMGAATHGAADSKLSRPLTPHQLEILRAWVTQLGLNELPAEQRLESHTKIAQVVIGMNSTAQRAALAAETPLAASEDPFDPGAFNSQHAEEVEMKSTPTDATSPPSTEPSEPAR